jgi:hypothetical protein
MKVLVASYLHSTAVGGQTQWQLTCRLPSKVPDRAARCREVIDEWSTAGASIFRDVVRVASEMPLARPFRRSLHAYATS